jgi:hypothetical protein
MMRLGHQAAAQAGWLAVAIHQGYAPQEVIVGAVIASAMCADDWSPDSDQGWVGKFVGGHRGVIHMPEVALGLIWGARHFTDGRGYDFAWQAFAVAWLTHILVCDLPFGRVPLLILFGRHVGFRFDTGGPFERVLTIGLWLAAVPLYYLALMPP